MNNFLEDIDRKILFAINGSHSDFLDTAMWWISDELFGIPFYIAFIYLSYRLTGLKGMVSFIILAILSIASSDLIAKYVFKEVFERYRPSHNLQIMNQLHYVNEYHGGMYGFVSSHAANMFAITTTFLLFIKDSRNKKFFLFLLFPAIVSISRVYLGVHYPSDIFVGALLGMFIALLLNNLLKSELVSLMFKITNK